MSNCALALSTALQLYVRRYDMTHHERRFRTFRCAAATTCRLNARLGHAIGRATCTKANAASKLLYLMGCIVIRR